MLSELKGKYHMYDDDLMTYNLFISHNGEGDEEYLTFIQKLIESPDFEWEDFGLPGKNEDEELYKQIEPVDIVIILSGLYGKHKDLIERQVHIAQELKKPVVLIRPYGLEEVPAQLEKTAQGVIGWNRVCIVETIEKVLNPSENDDY